MYIYILIVAVECSLHPYDLLECEPELVSGYYVDHGAVAFMIIYLAEGICIHVRPVCISPIYLRTHPT